MKEFIEVTRVIDLDKHNLVFNDIDNEFKVAIRVSAIVDFCDYRINFGGVCGYDVKETYEQIKAKIIDSQEQQYDYLVDTDGNLKKEKN